MKRVFYCTFFFHITSCSLNGINNQGFIIKGTWKHSYINSVSGDVNSPKKSYDGDIWVFNEETIAVFEYRNGLSIEEEPKVKTEYKIVGNSIEIGSYTFQILKHEQDELVLDYGDLMYFKKWK